VIRARVIGRFDPSKAVIDREAICQEVKVNVVVNQYSLLDIGVQVQLT
jgi:hypothetical protein